MTTKAPPTRASVAALLTNSRQELLDSFRGLAQEQMKRPLPDGWSVKDILAHVAMWDEMELPDMRRAVRGDKPVLKASDYSFIDQWNEIQFGLRKKFPLRQVLSELAEARQAMLDFLASIPDGRLTSGFIPVACAVQAKHDRDHATQIRAWRQNEGI